MNQEPDPSGCVLVLDDEEHVLASIRRSLEARDYRVTTCTDVAAAEEAVAGRDLAVALVDHRLAGPQTGLAFLQGLADRSPDCFRILFTGVADFDFVVDAINRGHIDAFLPKPWSDENLLPLLHQGVEAFRLRRRNHLLHDELLQRNRELEKFNQTLEIQVAERTRSLQAANRQMRQYQEEMVRLETQANLARLVRGLAHELNNPLAVILGQTEFVKRKLRDDPALAKRLESIRTEVDRCTKLIERLRAYYTPIEGELQDVKIPDAVDYARSQIEQRGGTAPAVEVEEGLPQVIALLVPLGEILEQVFDNALAAGAQRIRVGGVTERERVLVRIENDGETPGDEEVESALKPFYTTRPDERAGLGLALASSLMREFGGSIAFDKREPGPGAVVVLTLNQAGTSSIRKAIETTRIKRRRRLKDG